MYETFIEWISDPEVVIVFAIVFTTMTVNYLLRRFFNHLSKRVEATPGIWDDAALNSVRKPLNLLVWVIGISAALDLVTVGTDAELRELLDAARYVAVVVLLAYFLFGFTRELERGFVHEGADITTASAISKLVRVSILITAALTILQTLGVSVSGILAFGGVGGIAVGFAARDILANFFGSLMIYLDRPFAVGEWIRSPDREIEGTVVLIGWRLTHIRTFDQRLLYVPNSIFATIALENPSRQLNRRIYETIGVRYADAAVVGAIVRDVREMLMNHPEIDPDRTLIVNFNKFAPSSLEFFIYTFTRTTNWVQFHAIKEQVLLTILGIVAEHGAEVAFPTSTVHLAADERLEAGLQPEPE